MPLPHVSSRAALATLSALLLIAGCSRTTQDVVGPGSTPAGTAGDLELDPHAVVIGEEPFAGSSTAPPFYPLVVGNRWTYQGFTTILQTDRSGAVRNLRFPTAGERKVLCEQTVPSGTYSEEFQNSAYPLGPPHAWVYYRQDSHGLYQARPELGLFPCDSSGPIRSLAFRSRSSGTERSALERGFEQLEPSAIPAVERGLQLERARQALLDRSVRSALGFGEIGSPSRPPSDAQPGEIQLLRYPLRVGQRWIVATESPFAARVVSRQRVRTPAGGIIAYKIQLTSLQFGPGYRVFAWYGPVGYVGMSEELVGVGSDELGNFAGSIITRASEILTGYQLQEPSVPN